MVVVAGLQRDCSGIDMELVFGAYLLRWLGYGEWREVLKTFNRSL